MNKILRSLFVLLSTYLISTCFYSAFGQSPMTQSNVGSPYRYTGGWKAINRPPQPATAQSQSSRPSVDRSSAVQAAFYQPQGDIGLPAFPGNTNALANNYASDSMPTMPQPLPSGMPNALSSQQVGSLSDVGMANYTMPQDNYPPDNRPVTPPPQQQPFDAYAREQQQVLPPTQPNVAPYGSGDNLRAVQNNSPGNDLRPVAPTMQRGFGPNAQQIDVATGYPFVSPAPAPRTGNYPTSPYNGSLYRTVAFQNVVQPSPNPLSAVANTQPTLPQNAPLGVYPTQYQCTPGAATYPGLGAVPGNYVPPTLTPNLTPGTYSPNNSGYTPIFSLGQENYNVQIGRGIIGQPTVYVPGQPFRNFMRYLSP